jgi:hypothetical protein
MKEGLLQNKGGVGEAAEGTRRPGLASILGNIARENQGSVSPTGKKGE